ncbi:bactofilin family protein [Brenneria tiliae]|uniref:bactofilin family protein n=1 Tax=Brenneria tiliae TaxID=2914984 RepID=UPI002014B45D|nr:polymer-forming cytoskeletal protein [Brenneria tiliae]MCL2898007.1 polymer-forming cytoskeletal protein [Brenneria tiliae]MCL2902088.1 polymer-forming cytoskeletal protein [Brenneria tiliae]
MRNYNLLWVLWAAWALLVMVWLADIYLDLPALFYAQALAVALGIGIPALTALYYKAKRNNLMFSFDKNKKTAEKSPEMSEINNPAALINSVSPVRVKKDTFISQDAQITGKVEAGGNITVEGHIEGEVLCENTIKVEHIGKVKGEMKSQQIVINGDVEGRIYAGTVAILAQGKMTGEIFSDELSIEKGGVFIGQSNPLTPETPGQEQIGYAQKPQDTAEREHIAALADGYPLTGG